jgi:uncharacterized protein (DUF1499 family)
MKCKECDNSIDRRRLALVPTSSLCVECQSVEDVFKFKMKVVGFNDEPTIARSKKHWDVLKKQRKVQDI